MYLYIIYVFMYNCRLCNMYVFYCNSLCSFLLSTIRSCTDTQAITFMIQQHCRDTNFNDYYISAAGVTQPTYLHLWNYIAYGIPFSQYYLVSKLISNIERESPLDH